MKNEFIEQFEHSWNIFEGIVNDFDDISWIDIGYGYIIPARIAYHILLGTKYYLEDKSITYFSSGKPFENNWESIDKNQLPSRKDIMNSINEFRIKTKKWISELDFNSKNESFKWAGKTKTGVVIFLLRHILYHTGELNSLIYNSKNGNAQDNWIKAFK